MCSAAEIEGLLRSPIATQGRSYRERVARRKPQATSTSTISLSSMAVTRSTS